MAEDLLIDWGNIDRLFAAMNRVGDQAVAIDFYFGDHVCSPAGFNFPACALNPLADVMTTLDGFFNDMRMTFSERWTGLVGAVYAHAQTVDQTDGNIDHFFSQYRGSYGPHGNVPQLAPAQLEVFEIEDLEPHLPPPEPGDPALNHNDKFTGVVDAWEAAANTINWGVDILNELGASVPHLEEDLRTYIVYPLAGDYGAIRANANACLTVEQAMTEWGTNFSRLSVKSVLALQGDGALAFVGQLSLYDAVMKAVGFAIGRGSAVFDGIALVSESIAVELEDVLVILGERLISLSARVSSKFVPGVGWASLAWDFATGKLDDIIEDIQNTWDMINQCFDLVDEITEWARTQSDRLQTFQEVLDTVQQLPMVSGNNTLAEIGSGLDAIEGSLDDIATFGEDVGGRKDELDQALEDLAETTSA